MSKRTPTAEEILLWREINRSTRKNPGIEELPVPPASVPVNSPPQLAVRHAIPVTPIRPPKPKPPLAPLSSREAKKRMNSSEIEARLDLHGYSRLDAYALVQAFVNRHYGLGHRHVVIIPGKGRSGEGILRTELPHWLNEPLMRRYIGAFFNAPERSGGAGVVHVMLKANQS